eukprot:scaffold22639_cov105-Cylindrotheca_fusiformis.AAC.3
MNKNKNDENQIAMSPLRQQQQKDHPKPFFVMDWLEDLMELNNNSDQQQQIQTVAAMLKTPNKKRTTTTGCVPNIPRAMPSISRTGSNRSNVSIGSNDGTADTCIDEDDVEEEEEGDNEDNENPSSSTTPKSSNSNGRKRFSLDDRYPGEKKDFFQTSPTSVPKNTVKVPRTSQTPPRTPSHPSPPQQLQKQNSRKLKDRKIEAFVNAWNAKGLQKAKQGLWQDALNCWDRALAIDSSGNHDRVAKTYNNRGIALGKLGQYKDACHSLNIALQYYTSKSNTTMEEYNRNMITANTLHNLANVHQQAGKLILALQVFQKAKDACTKAIAAATTTNKGNTAKLQLGRVCTAMGHVFVEAQQWKDAKRSYQEALQYVKSPDERALLQTDIEKLSLLIQKNTPTTTAARTTSPPTQQQQRQR